MSGKDILQITAQAYLEQKGAMAMVRYLLTAPPISLKCPRRRRSFAELERDNVCPFPGCHRCYASKHSMQQHIRRKHRIFVPNPNNYLSSISSVSSLPLMSRSTEYDSQQPNYSDNRQTNPYNSVYNISSGITPNFVESSSNNILFNSNPAQVMGMPAQYGGYVNNMVGNMVYSSNYEDYCTTRSSMAPTGAVLEGTSMMPCHSH